MTIKTENFEYSAPKAKTPRSSKVRLSLDITPELDSRLEEIAAKGGATKSDVLRKAIALFDMAVQAKEQNNKLVIQGNGKDTEIIGI